MCAADVNGMEGDLAQVAEVTLCVNTIEQYSCVSSYTGHASSMTEAAELQL